ncbi:MAG: hypothetical protein HYY48_01185 [Gammaproteobacteria bacterium]|nr:hypothetical protein [Gammaproteobacteria bacterium]
MTAADKSANRLRREIAQLAAKIIAVDGVSDYLVAKRKAALRLGARPDKLMPSNHEIEEALSDYQRLFQGDAQPAALDSLRRTALEAMVFLKQFEPRLVGPVLSGNATRHSEIVLHLYSDSVEELAFFLGDQGVPFQSTERTLRLNQNEVGDFPAYRFLAGQTPVVLIVFSPMQKNIRPLSPIDGKPMQRADLRQVEALLQKTA